VQVGHFLCVLLLSQLDAVLESRVLRAQLLTLARSVGQLLLDGFHLPAGRQDGFQVPLKLQHVRLQRRPGVLARLLAQH
jgi:hypothetical protein